MGGVVKKNKKKKKTKREKRHFSFLVSGKKGGGTLSQGEWGKQ